MKPFVAYFEALKKFKETHKPIRCSCCLNEIAPGDDIVPDWDHEKVFCSLDCFCAEHDVYPVIFSEDDDEYSYWFEKIEGGEENEN